MTTLEWLTKLSNGVVNLDSAADATPATHEARPSVYSAGNPYTHSSHEDNETRGW